MDVVVTLTMHCAYGWCESVHDRAVQERLARRDQIRDLEMGVHALEPAPLAQSSATRSAGTPAAGGSVAPMPRWCSSLRNRSHHSGDRADCGALLV